MNGKEMCSSKSWFKPDSIMFAISFDGLRNLNTELYLHMRMESYFVCKYDRHINFLDMTTILIFWIY